MLGVDAGADQRLILGDGLLDVDLGVPRQVGGGVPLADLGLLVQLAQRRAGERVVPREDGVGVVLDDVRDLVGVGVGMARIASMSLISVRPMIVSLSLCVTVMGVSSW